MERNHRFSVQGVVTSTKMNKTIVVTVSTERNHPLYGKRVGYSKKYYAHDENNAANVGLKDGRVDELSLEMWDAIFQSDMRGTFFTTKATRPLSKMVRFRLVSIDQKVVTAENAAEAETKLEEAEGSSEVVAPAEEAK